MSREQVAAWTRAFHKGFETGCPYTTTEFGFVRCKADAENPDHEDYGLARRLWLRYLEERIAG